MKHISFTPPDPCANICAFGTPKLVVGQNVGERPERRGTFQMIGPARANGRTVRPVLELFSWYTDHSFFDAAAERQSLLCSRISAGHRPWKSEIKRGCPPETAGEARGAGPNSSFGKHQPSCLCSSPWQKLLGGGRADRGAVYRRREPQPSEKLGAIPAREPIPPARAYRPAAEPAPVRVEKDRPGAPRARPGPCCRPTNHARAVLVSAQGLRWAKCPMGPH